MPRTAAAASPGSVLGIQNLRLHPRPIKLEVASQQDAYVIHVPIKV